jgi:hypothetical protein
MSAIGKSSNGFERTDVLEQRDGSRFSRRLKFWHQATAGDTGISLSALVMPSAVLGKTNPNPSQLGRAKMLTNQNALVLRSSSRGTLEDGVEYQVTGDLQIQFISPFIAQDGEFFIGTMEEPNQFGTVVADALSFAVSTELNSGSTDVTLPFAVSTKALVGSQIPSLLVMRNGSLQRQNPGNASSSTQGNYYLVDPTGSGFSSLVRFNDAGVLQPSGLKETVDVAPIGVSMFSATDGVLQALQSLGAQADAMASVLAETAGVPTTTFQANPNYQDLRQYGDTVLDSKTKIATYVGENLSTLRQYSLTVTGVNWTTSRAVGVPYQTLDGTWRLRFNIVGTDTATSSNTYTITGVTFKTVTGGQTGAASTSGSARSRGTLTIGSGVSTMVAIADAAVTLGTVILSGDVELDSKPTFVP